MRQKNHAFRKLMEKNSWMYSLNLFFVITIDDSNASTKHPGKVKSFSNKNFHCIYMDERMYTNEYTFAHYILL